MHITRTKTITTLRVDNCVMAIPTSLVCAIRVEQNASFAHPYVRFILYPVLCLVRSNHCRSK